MNFGGIHVELDHIARCATTTRTQLCALRGTETERRVNVGWETGTVFARVMETERPR